MSIAKNLAGQHFGKLLAIRRTTKNKHNCWMWLCQCVCGGEKEIRSTSLLTGNSTSCGCTNRSYVGADSPLWKGGRKKTGNWKGGKTAVRNTGYIWKYVEPEVYHLFPEIHNKRQRYVGEHRYVMAIHLNRPLLSSESVHHKNGKKDDNRLENLELWSSSHPAGQRVEDLVSWAKTILEQYQ